jgi:hypothetical protein
MSKKEEKVAHLNILLDGVERLVTGDLELGVGAAGNLDNHIHQILGLVGPEGDVVKRGHNLAVLG